MASRPSTPRRSLSFKWKNLNVLKRTRTSSLSSSDATKTNLKDAHDDLSDYWRPLPDVPPRRSLKASEASKSSHGQVQKMSSKQLEVVDRDSDYYIEGGDVVFLVRCLWLSLKVRSDFLLLKGPKHTVLCTSLLPYS